MMNFQDIAAKYDGFIIDLWGVVHDGSALYPGAAETIAWLHGQGKPVVFLSNAPRVSAKAIAVLDRMGIPRAQYIDVITSGQVAHDWLKGGANLGSKYFYLGPGKDEDIIGDLPNYQRVTSTLDADFVLNTGFQYDYQPEREIEPFLKKLVDERRPFVCVNPDMEVVKQDGSEMLCAGKVADTYEKLGGRVTYIGKPHGKVYDVCRKLLPRGRVLAVGDNLLTDIKGANAASIDALLITGGILKARHKKLLEPAEALAACGQAGVTANYVLPSLAFGE